MVDSKYITATEGRMKATLETVITQTTMPKVDEKIQKTLEDSLIRTGVITKFYPYLDKAEVKLDISKKLVLCKILHRYGGDLIDFYTPLSDTKQIRDDKLKEPYIVPKVRNHVCVLKVHDSDSDENLILGYYQNDIVKGFNPAKPGNVKMMSITEPNLYWIKFGRDGLEVRAPKKGKRDVGTLPQNMKPIDYAESKDVYTKEESYNKDEVYNKNDVYTKEESYNKTEVYNKTESYNKTELYTQTEVDEMVNKAQLDAIYKLVTLEVITSTHASGTNDWTGKSTKLSSLTANTSIFFLLKQAPKTTDVTLNLTLKDGTTTTSAKDVYYNNAKLTNQCPKNSLVELKYDGEKWIVENIILKNN